MLFDFLYRKAYNYCNLILRGENCEQIEIPLSY